MPPRPFPHLAEIPPRAAGSAESIADRFGRDFQLTFAGALFDAVAEANEAAAKAAMARLAQRAADLEERHR